MNDADALKYVLKKLKAEAKVKCYTDEPTSVVLHGPFVVTFCLERNFAGVQQPTLAVSRKNRKSVHPLPPTFMATLTEVFGAAPSFIADQAYPKRGETVLFVWPSQPEG